MTTRYDEYVDRLRRRHPDKSSDAGLTPKFREHLGRRIEVRGRHGELRRGWVSGTTGWRPALMLLKLRTSSGSSDLLSDADEFVAIIDRGPR